MSRVVGCRQVLNARLFFIAKHDSVSLLSVAVHCLTVRCARGPITPLEMVVYPSNYRGVTRFKNLISAPVIL